MSSEIIDWLAHSPRIDWKAEFSYMLEPLTYEAALKNTSSLSMFIQGLNMEFREKNVAKAIQFYKEGATRLDPLCLCRLHDIYLGDESFKIEFDCNKSLVYLVFAGIYSQDILFQGSVVPFKKLKAFLDHFDPECKLLQNALRLTDLEEINPMKNLTLSLLFDFQNINQSEQRANFLKIFEELPLKIQKEIMYTIYLNEFRLPWEHVVKKKEALVLKLMMNPEIFSIFFESYRGLILMAAANKTLAMKFRIWIQSVLFVIEFAALSPNKKKYYKTLMPFVMNALDKDFFDGKDLICWLRYFLAYCYEKGIYVSRNLEKAYALIEKNIKDSPEGVKYPLRQALLLKQVNRINESKEVIVKFEKILEKRFSQQENSLLYYTKAKSFEKYYEDINTAIKYYKKGAAQLPEEVSQNTFFFYSYWRIRCARRLDKLIKKKEQGISQNKITTSIKYDHQPHQAISNSYINEKSRHIKNDSIEKEPQSLSPFLQGYSPLQVANKQGNLKVPENSNDSAQRTPTQGRFSTAATNMTGEKDVNTRSFSISPHQTHQEIVTHKTVITNGFKENEVRRSPEILIDSNYQERNFQGNSQNNRTKFQHKESDYKPNEVSKNGQFQKTENQILRESRDFFEKFNVPVIPREKINISSIKANNSTIAVANDIVYHVEGFEINNLSTLSKNEKLLKETFHTRNPKIISPNAIHLKEKSGKVAVYFLTPLPQLELAGAIQAEMFPDLKTKLHVALQIALCLLQIHDEHFRFYGALKPHKVTLDEYFGVKLHSPHTGIINCQNIEPDGYFAPEQLEGMHGQESDTWAFGVILWELIYSEKVTKDRNKVRNLYRGEKFDKQTKGKLLIMQELINRMISLEASERPTMKEVYEELKGKFLKG